MELKLQKRLAASLLKVGKNKIVFDSERLADIKEAITKEDVRGLIEDGAIKAKRAQGISRGRARKREGQKAKGRRKGIGRKKGKRVAKKTGKQTYVKRMRVFRKVLLDNKEKLSLKDYWQLRKEVKAGTIKTKKGLLEKIEGVIGER